jgi:hypothetical protein
MEHETNTYSISMGKPAVNNKFEDLSIERRTILKQALKKKF